MGDLRMMCRTSTPFTRAGDLDEDALRQNISRMADAHIGLYLASGNVGEGFTLSFDEIRRVYEAAVSECKGKVSVYANPPEQHTAAEAIRHARLAIEAGCDAVNLYPPAGWHGYKATEEEQKAFFEDVLKEIRHPTILAAAAGVVGYVPSFQVIAEITQKYTQVIGINVNSDERYLLNLRDRITRDVDYYFPLMGFMNGLALGATGLISVEANIIPKSFRLFLDLCEARDLEGLASVNAGILRYRQLVQRWSPGNARPTKMVMKVLKLPGGDGGPRPPNRLPGEDQLDILRRGLLEVGLAEIDDLARAAGLAVGGRASTSDQGAA